MDSYVSALVCKRGHVESWWFTNVNPFVVQPSTTKSPVSALITTPK
jgi:hypothetical protein